MLFWRNKIKPSKSSSMGFESIKKGFESTKLSKSMFESNLIQNFTKLYKKKNGPWQA